MNPETIEIIIYKHALKNALDHGKASEKAVAGKVFREVPEEAKKAPKAVLARVSEIVSRVNGMSKEEIKRELEGKFPDMLEVEEKGRGKKKEKKKELPPLPNAEMGKVVTRMPPEPNAYPHIGHAISFFFNWYYARRYDGKVILRFDDTNPNKERLEYYNAIKEGIKWLGLDWDEEHNMSDDMKKYYAYAEELIKKGKAYVCLCDPETIHKNRAEGRACEHRNQSVEENLGLWKKMLAGEFEEGKAILRYKGDMQSKNTVMRDPTLARIIIGNHPIQGGKYIVWPTYDFACSIEDAILGITHVLRSNEFELRNELQRAIRDDLGLRQPEIIHYSRFNVEGMKASKREIKRMIEEKKVTGWDDPRLVTLMGLKRRGIVPETIRELAVELGLSTSHPIISWDLVAAINRKNLDPKVNRYFAVVEPVKLLVEEAPKKVAQLKNHPNFPNRGTREIKTDGLFYISRSDAEKLKPGDQVRLKDLYNIGIIHIGENEISANYLGDAVFKDMKKIQWVTQDSKEFKLVIPDLLFKGGEYNPESLKTLDMLGEGKLGDLEIGEIVQLERLGFARKDSDDTFILAHK